MYFLFKMGIFHCYVCLPEGTFVHVRKMYLRMFWWTIWCSYHLLSVCMRVSSVSIRLLFSLRVSCSCILDIYWTPQILWPFLSIKRFVSFKVQNLHPSQSFSLKTSEVFQAPPPGPPPPPKKKKHISSTTFHEISSQPKKKHHSSEGTSYSTTPTPTKSDCLTA